MSPQTALEAAAKADDLLDLENHIAWKQVILPKLLQLKQNYATILVNHLLGTPLPGDLTKEQIAGKIYGIDEIINLFTSILKRGEKGVAFLESQGIHLSK